jgi:hypothetical protein
MIQKPRDALTDFPARSPDGPQHKGNIIKSGAIRQQLEVLKDESQRAPQVGEMTALKAGDIAAIDDDLALFRPLGAI